jgi:glutamate-5-semialdehyde dehydrogenase
MATRTESVAAVCAAAKHASRLLATLDTQAKNDALERIAAGLEARVGEILEANLLDLEAGRESDLSTALLDRLALDERRIAAMAAGVRQIIALPDPVGEVVDGFRRPNGLEIRKVLVPLGVIAVVYEARPNVTIDAAALCLKSGNAVVLRGSSSATRSNAVLAQIAAQAAPAGAISILHGRGGGAPASIPPGRDELTELVTQTAHVDLVIPRGGEGLKAALMEHATVPVIYAASGNCHVYVDSAADLQMASEIAINAKVQRPGVCNAAETLLVHREVAAAFLPQIARDLTAAGVELRGDEPSRELVPAMVEASEADWDTEYLALTLAVRVVDSLDEAIAHVQRHGTGHSEAIVTRDRAAARRFQREVDAACVYVNASTRFTDGGEFGMGAEIGNSTQKLHARGPIGLRELCTFKYLIEGDGQVRS